MKNSGAMTDQIVAPLSFLSGADDMFKKDMFKKLSIMTAALVIASVTAAPVRAASLRLIFRSDPTGITLLGNGTGNASVGFGLVQAYGGAVPAGVTKMVSGTSWSLSTPIDVRVNKSGCPTCSSYTMTAQLQASDFTHTWQLGTAILTNAFPATVTTAGVFDSRTAYTFTLTIPFTAPAGALNNTLDIMVVSN
jgi:hypothetical protein